MTVSGESAGQRRFAQKAEQILTGATQVFLQRGYERASMDKVAKASGVSKQTLYSHFADKEALFVALVDKMSRRQIQSAFGSAPLKGDPKDVLSMLARTTLTQLAADEDYHDFVRLMIGESKRFPGLVEKFLLNVTRPSLVKLSEFLADAPELGIKDPEATAHILLGAVVFFMLTQEVMPGKAVMPMEADRLADALMALL
ncbi:MAG: TetR/AcrR family transcriptional regulator [Cyanobacteria bacterium J06598_1]